MNGTNMQAMRIKAPGSPILQQVAKETEMSAGNLSQIERGEARMGPKARAKLAAFYGVTEREVERRWLADRLTYLKRETAAVSARLGTKRRARKARAAA